MEGEVGLVAVLPAKFSLGGSGLQPRKTRAWFSLPSPPNRGFTITVWKNLPPLLVVLLQAPSPGRGGPLCWQ